MSTFFKKEEQRFNMAGISLYIPGSLLRLKQAGKMLTPYKLKLDLPT